MSTPESRIQADILEYLKANGVMCWRNNNIAMYDQKLGHYRSFNSMKGVPDILAILPGGQFAGIEVKTPRGKQSADQLLFQKRATQLGARYVLARCVDDVKDLVPQSSPAVR